MNRLISKKDRKRQWERVRQAKGWTSSSYPIIQTGHVSHTDPEETVIYTESLLLDRANINPIL